MEYRKPIDVYKTDTLSSDISLLDLNSDELLQHTLKAVICIKLIHEQLPLLCTMTSRIEILEIMKQIKRLTNSNAYEGHTLLLNSNFHKQIFQYSKIKNKDSIIWHIINQDNNINCIYDGDKYISRDLLIDYLSDLRLFCILVSHSNTAGPSTIILRLNINKYLVITFPIVAIRLFDNEDHAITAFLQTLLLDQSYNLTVYYSD